MSRCNDYMKLAFPTIGTAPPKLVRPTAYSGEAFATLLGEALGR